MIKDIKSVLEKYQAIQKRGSEYISIDHIINDLYHLLQDARLKRLPADER